MSRRNQNYSKNEPKTTFKDVVATSEDVVAKRVIEETDSVQNAQLFVININGDLWVKSQFPYVTTEYKSEAATLTFEKAIAWREQIKMRRRVKAVIVEL